MNKFQMASGRYYGRVKLGAKSPVYKGRWVQLIEVTPDRVEVFIEPVQRTFYHDEIERMDLSDNYPQEKPR